jgi:hypothetical protein
LPQKVSTGRKALKEWLSKPTGAPRVIGKS